MLEGFLALALCASANQSMYARAYSSAYIGYVAPNATMQALCSADTFTPHLKTTITLPQATLTLDDVFANGFVDSEDSLTLESKWNNDSLFVVITPEGATIVITNGDDTGSDEQKKYLFPKTRSKRTQNNIEAMVYVIQETYAQATNDILEGKSPDLPLDMILDALTEAQPYVSGEKLKIRALPKAWEYERELRRIKAPK